MSTAAEQLIDFRFSDRYVVHAVRAVRPSLWEFAAVDDMLQRDVIVKVGRDDDAQGAQSVSAQLERARSIGAVKHPSLVALHDMGESDYGPFVVTEVTQGTSFASLIEHNGPLDVGRTLTLVRNVSSALAQLHSNGVAYLALRGESVILCGPNDHAKLLDVSFELPAGSEATVPTPRDLAYVCPDVLRGQQSSPCTDVFSFGALMFEMLTGQLPFQETDRDDLINRMRLGATPSVRGISGDCPRSIDLLIGGCLEPDTTKRPVDMVIVAEVIDRLIEDSQAAVPEFELKRAARSEQVQLRTSPVSKRNSSPKMPRRKPIRRPRAALSRQVARRQRFWKPEGHK
ncbi:MAG: hypothetical protein CMH53_06565 [Myxococcales bacterium]|nr:hypothetical protein [Myxococcales bacterium]